MEGNIFQQEINVDVPHNDFDLSFNNRLTCHIGQLIPTAWYLAVPGDKFDIRSTITVQTMPLQSPAYANLRVYNATFAVPIRLLWTHFTEFISPETPSAAPIVHPFVSFGSKSSIVAGSLGDYLGIPLMQQFANETNVSALPQRAYALIYNEWFRDENTGTLLPLSLSDGRDTINLYEDPPVQVSWRKDYFTSALPNPQFGNGAVASLNAGSTGVEVEEIRRANALQRWLEKASIVGHRYIESIFGHFGVRSRDARLQRPELIGFDSKPLRIDTVLQTSQSSDEETPTATRYGTMNSQSDFSLDDGSFFCDEHMIIMNLMFIRPDAEYIQGLGKAWTLWDRMDWPWPEFAHLGDEAIKNQEIYWSSNPAQDDADWAYCSRYAWLKYHGNEVHGEFLESLAHWVMPRRFGSLPAFNNQFLGVPTDADDDIFSIQSSDSPHYLVEIAHYVNANRPFPAFGMPSL